MEIFDSDKHLMTFETDKAFPTSLIIPDKREVIIPENSTAYGFAAETGGIITVGEKVFNLYKGMYFCVGEKGIIQNLIGLICLKKGYNGLFSIGGPIEKIGRLKYVDECSDTLLVSPTILGDPCLNYLYIPSSIDQVAHTHPSVRIGYIVDGCGYCLAENKKINLTVNSIFLLHPNEIHSFHTKESHLSIFVYHPDSDFGPTHDEHPMLNRTYIDGISLRGTNKYRTIKIKV